MASPALVPTFFPSTGPKSIHSRLLTDLSPAPYSPRPPPLRGTCSCRFHCWAARRSHAYPSYPTALAPWALAWPWPWPGPKLRLIALGAGRTEALGPGTLGPWPMADCLAKANPLCKTWRQAGSNRNRLSQLRSNLGLAACGMRLAACGLPLAAWAPKGALDAHPGFHHGPHGLQNKVKFSIVLSGTL
jgi:hypothetical protein